MARTHKPDLLHPGRKGENRVAPLAALLLLLNLFLAGCGLDISGNQVTPQTTSGAPATSTTDPYPGFKGAILIGGMFDLTGPTSAGCRDYAAGVRAYFDYFNSRGGAAGYKAELKEFDYAGKAPDAIETYQRFVKEGTVAFIGWNNSDTMALTSQLAEGKTPLFSTSYRDDFVRDPHRNPYNFMITPSYGEQMRLLLQYGRINAPDPSRKLGVANLLTDDDFGRYSLQPGRNYAAESNIVWFLEGFLNPNIDSKEIAYQVGRIKTYRPDWTFIQASIPVTAEILREAKKAGVDTGLLGMPSTGGPQLLTAAGAASEGFYAGVTLPYPTDVSPGMVTLKAWWRNRQNSGISTGDPEYLPGQPGAGFIQGWTTANVLLEGVRRAAVAAKAKSNDPAKLTGDDVKAALETLDRYDMDGLLPPISYSARNHQGSGMRFYKVVSGAWKQVAPAMTLQDMEKMLIAPTPAPSPTPTRKR